MFDKLNSKKVKLTEILIDGSPIVITDNSYEITDGNVINIIDNSSMLVAKVLFSQEIYVVDPETETGEWEYVSSYPVDTEITIYNSPSQYSNPTKIGSNSCSRIITNYDLDEDYKVNGLYTFYPTIDIEYSTGHGHQSAWVISLTCDMSKISAHQLTDASANPFNPVSYKRLSFGTPASTPADGDIAYHYTITNLYYFDLA